MPDNEENGEINLRDFVLLQDSDSSAHAGLVLQENAAPCESSADAPKANSSIRDEFAPNQGESHLAFGARFLKNDDDVWQQNAWDHVPPPVGYEELIATSLAKQRMTRISNEDKPIYNEKPSRHWDNFYKANSGNFFRDRKWLHLEFPELMAAAQPQAGPQVIAELGCGAGNVAFPLLSANQNPNLRLYAHDYSSHAIKLVQRNPLYLSPPVGKIQASVWDITSPDVLPSGIAPGTVDIVILVFVLSALHPDEWMRAITNVHQMLKPGGIVLLRDYNRYDLTQLRFKAGRLLEDNLYVRGDKTRVYFFDLDELALLFTGSQPPSGSARPEMVQTSCSVKVPGTEVSPCDLKDSSATDIQEDQSPPTIWCTQIHANLISSPNFHSHPLFSIAQLGVDRRLLVNRKRRLKMYRAWVQGKFVKLLSS